MRTEREMEIYKELKKRRKLGSGVDEWRINIELAQEFGVSNYSISRIESQLDSIIDMESNRVWNAIVQGFVGTQESITYNPIKLYHKVLKTYEKQTGEALTQDKMSDFEEFFKKFELEEYEEILKRAKKAFGKVKKAKKAEEKKMEKEEKKEEKKKVVSFTGETMQAYYMVRACELLQNGETEKAKDFINQAYDLNESLHTGKEKKIAELYRAVLD